MNDTTTLCMRSLIFIVLAGEALFCSGPECVSMQRVDHCSHQRYQTEVCLLIVLNMLFKHNLSLTFETNKLTSITLE